MSEANSNVDTWTAHENMPDHVPGAIMALIVGALNTEAKCITIASTPDIADITPVATVRANLAKHGAYDLVDPLTFNVQGLFRKMDRLLVDVSSNPDRDLLNASMCVRKCEDIGPFATGVAGALLDVSLTHNMPLRHLIGEQLTNKRGGVSAVETRLGALCTFASLAMAGEQIDRIAVTHEIVEQQRVDRSTSRRHIDKLIEVGILTGGSSRNNRILEFATLPDGRDTLEITMALLTTIGKLATQPYTEAERGRRLAKEIATNDRIVPALIKRSYASTGHTGKSTPRKHHR